MLFNLFLPFVQVLLHTYIDLLREGEEEEREINHHGKTIKVGGEEDVNKDEKMRSVTVHSGKVNAKLFSTNERSQQKAVRDYYKKYISCFCLLTKCGLCKRVSTYNLTKTRMRNLKEMSQ